VAVTSAPFPAPYTGKLTFRATVLPCEFAMFKPKVLISQPGLFGIGGWSVQTEVLAEQPDASNSSTRQRSRYTQEYPATSEAWLLIRDARRTSA